MVAIAGALPLSASWAIVLAAVVAQSVLLADGRIDPSFSNLSLIAIIPTLLVALWTRSLVGTVLTGVAAVALLRLLLDYLDPRL